MNEMTVILNDPKSMLIDRNAVISKIKHFDIDRFAPPPPDAPLWRHRNYERLLDKLVGFSQRREALPMPPNPQGLVDWGGPMDRPLLSNFIADRMPEAEKVDFNGDGYVTGSATIGAISRSLLGNRLDTALVIDTPRKTLTMWRIFNLIHSGFPWYNRVRNGENWKNFRTPLQARSSYEIFNSYSSKMPTYKQSLKAATDTMAQQNLGPLSDDLTYDPPMFDIGSTVLNISVDVSNHVSAMIRTAIKMESVSYMDATSLLMQMTAMNANKASSLSSFIATVNNSAASQAFEPVVNALACAFTKITIDIPANARQTTVMMVVTLMTFPSCIYDNQTKALIHNMFVGMVMPTNKGAYPERAGRTYPDAPMQESVIDFSQIRKLASESVLMPTPLPPRAAAGATAYSVRDSMFRLLSHFHGLRYQPREDGPSLPMSTAHDLWHHGDHAEGFAARPNEPLHTDTYIDHYFAKWGTIPNPHITPDTYLHDLIQGDPGRGPSMSKTVLASTFDHRIGEGKIAGYKTRPAEGMDYTLCEQWGNPTTHGMNVKVLGRYAHKGHVFAVVAIPKEEILRTGFADDVRVEPIEKMAVDDQRNVEFHAALLTGGVSEAKVYLIPEKDVMIHQPNEVNQLSKLRPRLNSILPQRGLSGHSGAMTPELRSFISEVIQPILNGVSTVGDKAYVNLLSVIMFNQRWATFMDYMTEAATCTMLTDYSPFGYTPLIYSTSQNLDASDAHRIRSDHSHSYASYIVSVKPAAHNRLKHLMLFEAAEGETNSSEGYWRYEPEPVHRTVTLEPSNMMALCLLGVAPGTPPDLTGSIALNLDSKAFNHDVAIMRASARFYTDSYDMSVFRSETRFETQTPSHKIEKFRGVLSRARSLFPVCSSLTSFVDKSLDQYELRQNQFWRSSPYIDYELSSEFTQQFDKYGGYQIASIRHRPLIPMCNSNSMGQSIMGYQDTLLFQIKSVIQPYIEHSLSTIDLIKELIHVPKRRVVSNVARTRSYGAQVSIPIGEPYVSPIYHDSPMLECKWLYNVADVGEHPYRYDVYEALAGRARVAGHTLAGITPSRSHAMVFSEWKHRYRQLPNVGTLLTFSFLVKRGIKIHFEQAKSLDEIGDDVKTPDVTDYKYPVESRRVTYTTPSQYVSKPQEIMDMYGVPSGVVPLLHHNQGPFIPHKAVRDMRWPANSDYTQPGSLTENIISDTPDGRTHGSCEFNDEMIGVVPCRVKPLSLVDPTSMLVLVRDPLATWYRM